MNKKKLTAAFAAVLILAGCSNGNKPAETTAAASAATTAAPETTTTASETAQTTTSTAATETSAAADTEKTPMFSAGNVTLYTEDATVNEWDMPSFGLGLARVSTGTYFDSDTNPDFFVTDEFTYNGETVPLDEIKEFRVGDKIGGLTVTEASTMLQPSYIINESGNEEKVWDMFSSDIRFDGEITFTGVARYFFDEQYTISSGDIQIIPDASYKGMPVAVDLGHLWAGEEPRYGYGSVDFDIAGDWEEQHYGGGLCVYTDAPVFRVGNLTDNYSDRTDMFELFDGGNANCTKKVEVTLTDVNISYSDQFGTGHCSAKIKDIKAIG